MSITVYPYKLTQRELEARLEPGLTVLPGQYLRFATAEPIFGQVREVRALPPSSPGLMGGYRLLIELLYGTPSLNPQQAILLNTAQMGHEIQRLQEPIAQPLRLSPDFSAELHRLGALTVIGGDDFVQKFEALQLMLRAIQPHCRVVIFDPLGIFAEEDGYAIWEAGRHVRLSLQAVGSKSFLDTFGELFAPGLRESALRIVADHLPPMHEFLGFQSLLDWYGSLNVPLKNLILQNFEQVAYASVFADAPEQTLDWARASQNAVTVLSLSGLPEAWRGLFFREALQALLAQSGGDVIPVLIHPENYLANLPQWVRRADESEFRLLMLASSYAEPALLNMANNRLWAATPETVSLIGSLTLGLPLKLPALNASAASGPRSAEASFIAAPASTAVSANMPAAPVEERMYGAFSSFNVPIVDLPDGEPGAGTPDFSGSEMEPPLHWLGEAAGPLETPGPDEAGDPFATLTAPQEEFTEPETASKAQAVEMPGVDLTAAAVETPVAVSPVVDLSAPRPEGVPEFLSASQLSDLLASGTRHMDAQAANEVDSADAEPFHTAHAQASETLAPVDLTATAASHPSLTPEPAFPPTMEDPVFHQQPDEGNAALLSADHFPPPELALEPTPAGDDSSGFVAHFNPDVEPHFEAGPELQNMSVGLSAQPAPALPPFPTPEEYEREEFHFDLNPDPTTDEPSFPNGQGVAYGEPDFITQSLNDFAASEPTSVSQDEEEGFHFEANFNGSQATTAHGSESQEGSGILSGIAATDQELSDTLDLIFPNYPHAGQAEEHSDEPEPEAPVAPKPVRDEPMEIIQKDIEPLRGQSAAFQVGDRVTHPAYGQGVVQKVIPTEESVVLNILFDSVGKRLLDPALCELAREAVR